MITIHENGFRDRKFLTFTCPQCGWESLYSTAMICDECMSPFPLVFSILTELEDRFTFHCGKDPWENF